MTTSASNIQQQPFVASYPRDQGPTAARFDCWKTDTTIVLSGDFPGIKSDQFSIEFHDQVLTITAEHDPSHGFRKALKSEFAPKSLERSFRIHEEIHADGIKATYDNAVLTVVLPIVQPIAPHQIPVSSS